ncbi:hypothetical protein DT019_35940 [Streptomyces sp. SDr-06]|nr:hypothetical protein DT019_35940 [Streptomyces sp. SDr-06]
MPGGQEGERSACSSSLDQSACMEPQSKFWPQAVPEPPVWIWLRLQLHDLPLPAVLIGADSGRVIPPLTVRMEWASNSQRTAAM